MCFEEDEEEKEVEENESFKGGMRHASRFHYVADSDSSDNMFNQLKRQKTVLPLHKSNDNSLLTEE